MTCDQRISDDETGLSRRGLMRLAGATAFGLPWAVSCLSETAYAVEDRKPLNRLPRMTHEFFVDQVRRAERRKLLATSKLKTKEDAEKYVESVRRRIRECFGPEPERTPLNPRITKVIEQGGY